MSKDFKSNIHFYLTKSAAVAEIAAPLFNVTELSFFSYGQIYNRDSCFVLHSDIQFLEHSFESHMKAGSSLSEGIYCWDDIFSRIEIHEALYLKMGNGIFIVKHYENFSEIIGFGAPLDAPNMSTFYLNHLELLNKFILYFKEKASNIIFEAFENLIQLPNPIVVGNLRSKADDDLIRFRSSLQIKKYNIDDKYNGIKLSRREIQCLNLTLRGKTAVQIGNELNLAKSTIDSFISSTKKKFGCKNSSELFELFWDLGILKSNGYFDI